MALKVHPLVPWCERLRVDTIETERLLLRPWETSDLADYGRIFSKPETLHFPLGRGLTFEESRDALDCNIARYQQSGVGQWAAVIKSESRIIGWIGLSYVSAFAQYASSIQVGWRLDPDYWHQGYATEGGRASVSYGFEHYPTDEILVLFETDNRASRRVAERLGASHKCDSVATSDYEAGRPHQVFCITRQQWSDMVSNC